MGKEPGRPKRGRLADMATYPQVDTYQLPPAEELEPWPLEPIGLDWGAQLRGRFVIWLPRNKVVEFSISQVVQVDGEWREVSRIDTCHAKLHRHQFGARHPDVDLVEPEVLAVVHADGWNVVDSWYHPALNLMQTEWENYYRRWERDAR